MNANQEPFYARKRAVVRDEEKASAREKGDQREREEEGEKSNPAP